jgi:hypothetical protein
MKQSFTPFILGSLMVLCWGGEGLSAQQGLVPRQVAAEPEDIVSGLVRLPDPAEVGRSSRSAWMRVPFVAAPDGGWVAHMRVPVSDMEGRDSKRGASVSRNQLSLIPLGMGADRWSLEVRMPDGALLELEQEIAAGRAQRVRGTVDQLAPGFPAVRTDIPATPGLWEVTLSAPSGRGRRASKPPEGYLLVAEPGSTVLQSHLTTHALLAGDSVGVQAQLDEASTATSMELYARTPDGVFALPMLDDGQHDDGLPDDGVFGAVLPPMPAGPVFAQVIATGFDENGWPLLRTSEHSFTLIEPAAVFTGEASTFVLDEARLSLQIGAWVFGEPQRLHVSTEVWGTDASGTLVPVCWLSTMLPTIGSGGAVQLPLALDVRWLNRQGASAPLELRHLRIQDPDSGIPMDTWPLVRLESVAAPPLLGAPAGPVFASMTMGPSPIDPGGQSHGVTTTAARVSPSLTRGLMLSHGYCAGGNPWPVQHFSGNLLEFHDPNQNRSHDEFAQLIGALGTQLDSFGLIGHSQGGNAGLHLYTYYQSGLDHATDGRLIQGVAVPWLGSPLASTLAGLGGIFGVGCGSNDNMSDNGAAIWLAGIPSWARAEVYYWTTQNSGSSCNIFTGLFLDSPNDGVVEKNKGQLSGGTDLGHISGWCHTTGMSSPASYLDQVRNMERDAAAAR